MAVRKQQQTARTFDLKSLEEAVEKHSKHRERVYAAALWYIQNGIPVIPVQFPGKSLVTYDDLRTLGLDQKYKPGYEHGTTAKDKIDLWFHPDKGQFKGFNIGFCCGPDICAIDLDVKQDRNGWTEYIKNVGPIEGNTPVARTPTGGSHLLFLGKEGVRTTTNALGFGGIDIRSGRPDGAMGSHIVVYPSLRKLDGSSDLKEYRWLNGGEMVAPPVIFIKVVPIKSATSRGNENVGEEDSWPDPTIPSVIQALKFCNPDTDYQEWCNIGMSIHSMFDGEEGFNAWDSWSSAAKVSGTYPGSKACWDKWNSFGGDRGITINTLFKLAVAGGYREGRNFSPKLVLELRYGSKGQILQVNHNLHAILTSEDFSEKFGGDLGYDLFMDHVSVGDKVFQNEVYTEVAAWLSSAFGFERGKESVRDYARMVARTNEMDSLKNYVDALEWDGVDRMNKLSEILCANNDYQSAAITRWLVGGIARAYVPGCTATHMLILFGKQGIGKSRFFRHLSPDSNWFTDSPTFKFSRDTSHRDEEIKLQGKWIIEVPELAGIWKSDFNDLKNFLTLQAPVIRRPYDTDSIALPRRCIFGGTTNMDTIINDPTGGRRFAFLSLWDHKIDVDWTDRNRDQIWAQAAALYKAHEKWWFNDEEYLQQISENKNFEREHPWVEAIEKWAFDKSHFTSQDVHEFVIKKGTGNLTQKDSGDTKSILESLGFIRKTVRMDDGRTSKLWTSPNPAVVAKYTGRRWGIDTDSELG